MCRDCLYVYQQCPAIRAVLQHDLLVALGKDQGFIPGLTLPAEFTVAYRAAFNAGIWFHSALLFKFRAK